MQHGPLRRYARRVQPRPAGPGTLSHTAAPVDLVGESRLHSQYLASIRDDLNRSQAEQDLWFDEVLLAVNTARANRIENRLRAQTEASRYAEQQQQEHQRIQQERLARQRAEAAEWDERQRQEMERIVREQEQAEQRRREEQAAAEEARRRAAEEADRQRRARLRECAVCMDENDVDLLVQAPCDHWYCRTCLRDCFEASYASRSQFRCCQRDVPIALVAELLTNDFTSRYELMVLEQTTLNPTYCANVACGAFIPPANYHGPDTARCLQCRRDTCRHCRTRDHVGQSCTADEATEQTRALAAIVGWKTCPRCGQMVERRDGCLHMTCLCGAEFCYRCGDFWQECRSGCQGR